MPTQTSVSQQAPYDPRYFIWTIVFLVVTGISLVSYIMLSDSGANDIVDVTHAARVVPHKAIK